MRCYQDCPEISIDIGHMNVQIKFKVLSNKEKIVINT